MLAGSGLQFKPSMQVGAPLLEADVDLPQFESHAMMPTPQAFSYTPARAMEDSMAPQKQAPEKKKKKDGKNSQAKNSTARKMSAVASTISLGEELPEESLPPKRSMRTSTYGGYLPSMTEHGQERSSSYGGYLSWMAEHGHETSDMAPVEARAEGNVDGIVEGNVEGNARFIDEESRRLIAKSWQELREHEERCKRGLQNKKAEESDEAAASEGPGSAEGPQAGPKKSSGVWSKMFGRGGKNQEGETTSNPSAAAKGKAEKSNNSNNSTAWDIPQTFKEMCFLNAGMTGANISYIEVVESCFENLVTATISGDFVRLEVESNIMALRMSKDVQGSPQLNQFKTCMLASLRSLLPKMWSIAHEQAWSTMWEVVQSILTITLPLPGKYEKAVERAVSNMSEEDKKTYGLNAFNRFFDKQPKAEDHFNTSNARLSVLAMRGLVLSQDIYKEPTRLVNDVTQLGLKHIMFNISTEYFDSFVEAMVEELQFWFKDQAAIEGVEWALTQIAAIMIYTIREGSNPLLQAVLTNNAKKVREALAPVAKKDRAAICLGATGKLITSDIMSDTRM